MIGTIYSKDRYMNIRFNLRNTPFRTHISILSPDSFETSVPPNLKGKAMTKILGSIAILMTLTVSALAAANATPPSAQQCANDTDHDGHEQPSKCADSDTDGK